MPNPNYGHLVNTVGTTDIYVPVDPIVVSPNTMINYGFRLVSRGIDDRTLTICVSDIDTGVIEITESRQFNFVAGEDIVFDPGYYPMNALGYIVTLTNINALWATYDILPGPSGVSATWLALLAAGGAILYGVSKSQGK